MFNRNIDSFFSNEKYLTRDNKSSILVTGSVYKDEGGEFQTDTDFQMKFDLPYIQKRLKITVEKEQQEIRKAINDENITASKTKTISRQGRTSDQGKLKYTTSATYNFISRKFLPSQLKIGLRIDLPVNPFAKMTFTKELHTKYIDIGLSQFFFYYRQDGFQEISQIVFDHEFNETFHIEQLNSLVWTDKSDLFILRDSLSLYQKLDEKRGFSYSAGANAKLSHAFYYDSYDSSVSYRQQMVWNWLFATYTVGMNWGKDSDWKAKRFGQFKLDVLFK